jgi:transglutaminase-like putative cysteine protease
MDLRIGFEMTFAVPAPTPMLLLLYVRPEVAHLLHEPERLLVEPAVPVEDYIDGFGNRAARIVAPAGRLTLRYDTHFTASAEPEPSFPDARQHPIEELPTETLQFLLPSRYCEVDRLGDAAWKLFGATPPGWARVQAISDWVHNHIEFGYAHASSTMGAYEVFESGKGVCRDYAHLALTFCRCMNIPARYATGYLGDIDVPPTDAAMDFTGFFEVYLGGQWHPFDARNNKRRIGRVVMAYGRDAADTALTTAFNNLPLEKFEVWTDEVKEA